MSLLALVIVALAIAVLTAGAGARAGSATSNWPAAKARIDDQQQQALAAARAHPQPKLLRAVEAAAVTPAARQTGILAMRQGPFPPATFLVRNFWQGPIGSEWLLAYSGAEPSTAGAAARGAIRLYSESEDLRLTLLGTFSAPDGTGPLTIVAANGDVLQLRADDGTALTFDLATLQFR